ncbi:hypothetical protein VTK56DRAFT_4203 [Thermocarpiscus australiensis]
MRPRPQAERRPQQRMQHRLQDCARLRQRRGRARRGVQRGREEQSLQQRLLNELHAVRLLRRRHCPCWANCTAVNPPYGRCGDGIVQPGEQCDDGAANNGRDWSACDAHCKTTTTTTTSSRRTCETCTRTPFFNKRTMTTSCIAVSPATTISTTTAPAARLRLLPADPRQFRLDFQGQENRGVCGAGD